MDADIDAIIDTENNISKMTLKMTLLFFNFKRYVNIAVDNEWELLE